MKPPAITITDAARSAIAEAAAEAPGQPLRIIINEAFAYDFAFDVNAAADLVVDAGAIAVVLDPVSASRADGMTIDFVDKGEDSGFTVDNPNQPRPIRQISAHELKEMLDGGDRVELVDVRTQQERAVARIEGSRLLDDAGQQHLLALDRDTPIVFQCHHGMRSQAAAEQFQREGFRNLYNLSGGIDAWSRLIDPSVARY